jgi:hypothetical protein
MKLFAESVAADAAPSSRQFRPGDARDTIFCLDCERRGCTEADCYKRQRDIKRKTNTGASTETIVDVALDNVSTPTIDVPQELPAFF